jgi:hypothetical protein
MDTKCIGVIGSTGKIRGKKHFSVAILNPWLQAQPYEMT